MSTEQILAQLAAIFNTPYHLQVMWYGGHGNEPTAQPQDHNQPTFLLVPGFYGWFIGFDRGRKFGLPNTAATRWLALGHDPREVSNVRH